MSSEENIFNMYRSLLNTLHNQYGRTLDTLESIEFGMRQSIFRNNQFLRYPAQEYRSPSSFQVPHFTENNQVPLSANTEFTRQSSNYNNAPNHINNNTRSVPLSVNSTRNTRPRSSSRSGGNTLTTSHQANTATTTLPTTTTSISGNNNDNFFNVQQRSSNSGNGNVNDNAYTFSTPALTSLGGFATFPRSPFTFMSDNALSNIWNPFSNTFDASRFGNLTPVMISPTREQINSATETIMYNTLENPTTNTCPISLEPFNDEDEILRIKSCGHYFIKDKILAWFNSHVHCPLCRYDIREWSESEPEFNESNNESNIDSINESSNESNNEINEVNTENNSAQHIYNSNNDEEQQSSNEYNNHNNSNSNNNNNNNATTSSSHNIQNILELLTNEVSNHLTSRGGGLSDSIHIELESHPILIQRRNEVQSEQSTSNNQASRDGTESS